MSRMWTALMLEAADAEAKKMSRQRMLLQRLKNRERLLQKIPEWQFRAHYRLNKEEFHSLCDELRHNTSLKGSKTTSLELKVLTALSFYAMGSYQKGVANEVHMNQKSVSRCIREVTKALNEITNKWIQFSQTSTQRTKIKQGYVTVISESLMLMPSLVVQVTTVISGQVADCKAIWRLCNYLVTVVTLKGSTL
ncbi:putative nuclease HARBI1 isoform X4 [Papilio machaon]|uniref:putative nuclease HARBI1 isoform X4 n=1 Tax=Papilio machaon TaxID=76193 RepID=UPI001E6645AA|nr:putative nuclease HARBI1 isoform X4 [Papilio machaon]